MTTEEQDKQTTEQQTTEQQTATDETQQQPQTKDQQPEANEAVQAADGDQPQPEAIDYDAKIAELEDKYLRCRAEFDNYRKRMARDREDLVKSAAKDVVQDILATVDNLARALDGAKDKAEDPFVQGVKLVYDGLLKALEKHGATPIDSVGEPFNADYHEAVAQLPSQDVEEGVITNEVLRGWLLHGKLLRAAKVVVSAGKGA